MQWAKKQILRVLVPQTSRSFFMITFRHCLVLQAICHAPFSCPGSRPWEAVDALFQHHGDRMNHTRAPDYLKSDRGVRPVLVI